MTSLKQFFSYFGSKVSLSRHYPAPEYGTIIEPFAGSAGYACRFPQLEVRLFDLDPVVVGVWAYLIRATRQDVLSLPIDPSDASALSKAERDFIGFWWRRGGAEPCAKPVPWMLSGKYPYSFWSELTRERIANQVEKINHWTCGLLSWEKIPVAAATWFIDPPYQLQGKRYKHGSKGIQYLDLGAWAKSLPGQIIVCEAAGADWLPFRPLYSTRTVKYHKADRTIQEVVYP